MSYDFENITVLVVESSHAMFDLTKSVLITFGVNQIYSSYGFQQGFDTFCHINPDLIIMDWMEEPNNGLELTKRIRADSSSPNPFVPIILMTGYTLKKRVIMARDSGITTFMAKPYTAKALYKRIEQLVERPRQFVKSESYFGPDRRALRADVYKGPERRSDTNSVEVPANVTASQLAREIRARSESQKEKK